MVSAADTERINIRARIAISIDINRISFIAFIAIEDIAGQAVRISKRTIVASSQQVKISFTCPTLSAAIYVTSVARSKDIARNTKSSCVEVVGIEALSALVVVANHTA